MPSNTPDAKLPELPAPARSQVTPQPPDASGLVGKVIDYYTADQMHSYAREATRTAAGWRPMESAPRDRGVYMLGLVPDGSVPSGLRACTISPAWRVEYFRNDDGSCRVGDPVFSGYDEIERDALTPARPTHWQPLPAPPSPPDAREDSNEN